jgi:hypothetical protein
MAQNLVKNLCFCDLFLSINFYLQFFSKNVAKTNTSWCNTLAAFETFSELGSIIWTFFIAISIYSSLKYDYKFVTSL